MLRFIFVGLLLFILAGCSSDSDLNVQAEKQSWQTPVLFSAVHEGFQGARLVVDGNGKVLLAWTKDSHVWASSSSDGLSWSNPEQIDDATSWAGLVGIAMNASGQAALMWNSQEATGDYFKARLYKPMTGWETAAQFLDALTVDGTGGSVGINDSGNVMTVFARYGTGDHVWARAYDESSGWNATATALDTPPSWSNYPDVAVDKNGKATVVWEQWDGSRTRAFARSYITNTGWDAAPTELTGTGEPDIDKVRLSLNANGDGLAHWTLADYSGAKVRRLVGGVWQPTETVATDAGTYNSVARVAPDGRIVQTWTHNRNVYARICVNGVWDTAATLVSDDAQTVNLRTSVMAMDRTNGRVIVMWTRLAEDDADGSAVWARRYDPVSGWSPVEQVVPWTPGILYDVDSVVLHDDGRVLAVLAGEDYTVWKYSTYLISYR